MVEHYSNAWANLTVVLATLATVSVAVLLHYEGLSRLSRVLGRSESPRRRRVLYAIMGVLALHVTEIWLFGLVMWSLLLWPACGTLHGASHAPLLDAVYLSAMTYTTVGFGDLAPLGAIRFLSGTEALTGFVLITWSASFTFLEMERFWRQR
jgi:Ion channel